MMLTKTPSRFEDCKKNICSFDYLPSGINNLQSKKSKARVRNMFAQSNKNVGHSLSHGCHDAHILSLIYEGLS